MKVNGSHSFAASRDTIWPMLLDPNVLKNVVPGAETLEEVDENKYKGVLRLRVGPVQGKFNGTITLTNINAPESYEMELSGRGPAGFVKGKGTLRLEENGEATTLHYDGDAQVGGRIASVGQRLLDTSSRAIIRQSLQALEEQIEAHQQRATATGEAADAQPAVGPTQTELQFISGVAKNFVEELVPPEQRGDVVRKVAMALGAMLLLRLVTNWWINRLARRVADIIEERR